VCETDSPIGKSNSSFQSFSGTVLELVMVKWAMKPVCHVDVTDNVAVAAAARAAGVVASPTIAANARAKHAISAFASRVSCSTFAQLKPL
jgi:hypothetical protein